MSCVVLLILFLTVLFSGCQIDASVYCYVCHWSKTSETVVDICSPGYLDTSKVKIDTCTTGCHTVTFYEGNETTMFSRQCSQKTVHHDECKTVEVVSYMRQKLCYCGSNYCNTAVLSSNNNIHLLLVMLNWLIWNYCCT